MLKNSAASVKARLKDKAKKKNINFQPLLELYAMERFLYRLSQSKYAKDFVLKGGFRLASSAAPQSRTTRDIDLLAHGDNSPTAMAELVKDILNLEVEDDGLIFGVDSIKAATIKEGADHQGVRVTAIAYLERAKISVQIDMGFGDVVTPKPELLEIAPLLDGMPAPELLCYPFETIIAEKFEALVAIGLFNSRLKDFYDLQLLSTHYSFDFVLLQTAIEKTFERRGTDLPSELPPGLSDEYIGDWEKNWLRFIEKLELDAPELRPVVGKLRTFLAPFYDDKSINYTAWKDGKWHI